MHDVQIRVAVSGSDSGNPLLEFARYGRSREGGYSTTVGEARMDIDAELVVDVL